MIRFLYLNAFIAIFTIIFCVLAVVLFLFDRTGRLTHFYSAAPWARGILWVCGIKVRVRGQENIIRHVPHIYVVNHQSYFDIFALLACLPVDFKFVVKKELMQIPFFGFAMKRAGYISIDREEPREAIKSMNAAAERIRNGMSVLIFPEGTRSEDGQLLPFKSGAFHLAIKSGCAIVPVAIINSREIVPKGSLRINKGSFAMHIGRPIPTAGYHRKNLEELAARVREAMIELLNE